MTDTHTYLGKYYIFHEVDYDGNPTDNRDATYLQCRYKSQIYRFDEDTLAIDFMTTNSANIIISELRKEKIKIKKFSEGSSESTYLFSEKKIDKVAKIMKPRKKGKNIQMKGLRDRNLKDKQKYLMKY